MSLKSDASSGNIRRSGSSQPSGSKTFSNGARAPKQPRPSKPPKR